MLAITLVLVALAASAAGYEYGYPRGYDEGVASGQAVKVVSDGTRVNLSPGEVFVVPIDGVVTKMLAESATLNVTGHLSFLITFGFGVNNTVNFQVRLDQVHVAYSSGYSQSFDGEFTFVVTPSEAMSPSYGPEVVLGANPSNTGEVLVTWTDALVLHIGQAK